MTLMQKKDIYTILSPRIYILYRPGYTPSLSKEEGLGSEPKLPVDTCLVRLKVCE